MGLYQMNDFVTATLWLCDGFVTTMTEGVTALTALHTYTHVPFYLSIIKYPIFSLFSFINISIFCQSRHSRHDREKAVTKPSQSRHIG